MISSSDLASLKTLNEAAMPERCSIVRRSGTVSDGAGGQTDGTTTVASNVPCRVRRTSKDPRTRVIAERIGITAVYEVVFPTGTDIRAADQLAIYPAEDPAATRNMTVEAVLQGSYETGKVCVCIEGV